MGDTITKTETRKATCLWKCPTCKKLTNDFGALSRKDNKTKICDTCGQDEAMEAFSKAEDKGRAILVNWDNIYEETVDVRLDKEWGCLCFLDKNGNQLGNIDLVKEFDLPKRLFPKQEAG